MNWAELTHEVWEIKVEHCNLVCDSPKDFSHHLLQYLEDVRNKEEYRYLTSNKSIRYINTTSSLVIHDMRYICTHNKSNSHPSELPLESPSVQPHSISPSPPQSPQGPSSQDPCLPLNRISGHLWAPTTWAPFLALGLGTGFSICLKSFSSGSVEGCPLDLLPVKIHTSLLKSPGLLLPAAYSQVLSCHLQSNRKQNFFCESTPLFIYCLSSLNTLEVPLGYIVHRFNLSIQN